MSNLLYPILQALDEHYLDVDVQFGGVDQRKIFMFARENLPRIGYKKRAHLMNPLIPGLGESGKMSSSEPLSKVELDESVEAIKYKLGQAFSRDGQVEGNGLLAILKHVLFRYLNKHEKPFTVPRPAKWGGPQEFKTYEEVESAFASLHLASLDLKNGMIALMNEFLAPLRAKIAQKKDLAERAYPGMSSFVIPGQPSKKAAVAAPAKKGKAAVVARKSASLSSSSTFRTHTHTHTHTLHTGARNVVAYFLRCVRVLPQWVLVVWKSRWARLCLSRSTSRRTAFTLSRSTLERRSSAL